MLCNIYIRTDIVTFTYMHVFGDSEMWLYRTFDIKIQKSPHKIDEK